MFLDVLALLAKCENGCKLYRRQEGQQLKKLEGMFSAFFLSHPLLSFPCSHVLSYTHLNALDFLASPPRQGHRFATPQSARQPFNKSLLSISVYWELLGAEQRVDKAQS